MKDRRRILFWLSAWVVLVSFLEFVYQYNFRSYIPQSELEEFSHDMKASSFGLPLLYVHSNFISAFERDPFHVKAVSRKVIELTDLDISGLHDSCCSNDEGDCVSRLVDFSSKHNSSFKFWFFHDPSCSGTFVHDNVGFSGFSDPTFLIEWGKLAPLKLSGVFDSGAAPISFVRLLLVQSTKGNNRIEWDSADLLSVETVLDSISGSTEIGLETQLLYSGDDRAISEALEMPDAYEKSRILNQELAVWKGSGHLLEFGAYSMPPLSHIAVYLSSDLKEGVYDVTDFGKLVIRNPSNVLTCFYDGGKCSVNSDLLADIAISVIRSWLGLAWDSCKACTSVFSNSERIAISGSFRKRHLEGIESSIRKKLNILSGLPRLKFGKAVSDLMLGALNNGRESLREENLRIAVERAKIGSAKAAEALSHESVSSLPYFSWEFRLALYGPLLLPVCVPLVAAWISIIRKQS